MVGEPYCHVHVPPLAEARAAVASRARSMEMGTGKTEGWKRKGRSGGWRRQVQITYF
jgi:hypothetical protein